MKRKTITNSMVSAFFKNALSTLGVAYERILMFGSRATGTERADSDWDVMIVTRDTHSDAEIRSLRTRLRIMFHDTCGADAIDIIVMDRARYEEEKRQINTMASAATAGVPL